MDAQLASLGYEFGPSKYSPALGYYGLRSDLSTAYPATFDIKLLYLPAFEGWDGHSPSVEDLLSGGGAG